MDCEAVHEATSVCDSHDQREDFGEVEFSDRISWSGEAVGEIGKSVEFLTRLELDLACASEKIVNLNVLMMHVATRENDFEAFASKREQASDDSLERALEFDFLSGVLDSEVRELDGLMAELQMEIFNARELVSSCSHEEGTLKEMEEKLRDSEQSFEQSGDQISEIRAQSETLQNALSRFNGEENWNKYKRVDEDQFFNMIPNKKMPTAEQQRHILRMLEKSLAREIDLEKKLADMRQVEEELKQRLLASEREVNGLEDETADVSGRWIEADNNVVVLKGLSNEQLGRLQTIQFNVNGSVVQETQLRPKLEKTVVAHKAKEYSLNQLDSSSGEVNDLLVAQTNSLKASLKEAEEKLIIADLEASTLREKVLLEKQLKESEIQLLNAKVSSEGNQKQQNIPCCDEINIVESVVSDSKDKTNKEECWDDNAEVKCGLLTENNAEINKELKSCLGASDKVESLERQLRESDLQLKRAVASAEASQEKQNLLYATIEDMQNLIDDLKMKVVVHERLADSMEEKCNGLSKSNAELNEELAFLRGRLGTLEASLQQGDETKISATKGIGLHAKVVKDLVVQLAFERNRLHKQISSLAVENKRLVQKLQGNSMDQFTVTKHGCRGSSDDFLLPKQGSFTASCSGELREEVAETSPISSKLVKTGEKVSNGKTEVTAIPGPEGVRRIDAEVLSFKHFLAILILLISVAAYFYFQLESCPF